MGVTRREFVGAMLGASALYACRGKDRHLPPGTLAMPGMQRAHSQIRDGHLVTPHAWRTHDVVIVGGGVAGLGAAWQLRKLGVKDVVVLELDDVFGGTARGGESSVTPYPWGAHYIVAPQAEQVELTALLQEMNAIEGIAADGSPIVDEALRCREPEERVWYMGRWWEGLYLDAGASPTDRAQLAKFRAEIDTWSAWRDAQGRRAFAIPRSRGTDDLAVLALDRISFAQWLDERGLKSPRLRWLTDYACRDDYALTAAETSAWAGLFYFAARQKGPGLASQTVITWPNGNGALVAQLAKTARIEKNVVVQQVTPAGDVIANGPDGPFGIHARSVIVATPSFVANRIAPARALGTADYGSWVVANVHLRERPHERGEGAPPAWDNVFRDSMSLGFVSATHQRGRDRGPTVWTWYYPFSDADPAVVRKRLAGAGYEEWAETICVDLEAAYPEIRTLIDHIEVTFWGHGMIRPRIGAACGAERLARIAANGAIHYAHTDLSGLALFEEAFDHGLRAAREIAG
ncbi:MAG: FAD-dependent oxidoreductase [Kofleriaceae bacterium]